MNAPLKDGSNPLHASTVAIDGMAVLLMGPSGVGKSDLALRLIDRGAVLVSDDYTQWRQEEATGRILASAPTTIVGRIEIRGIGIIPMPCFTEAPVALAVMLTGNDPDPPIDRLPLDPVYFYLNDYALPLLRLNGLEGSAPLKIEYALRALKKADNIAGGSEAEL